MNPPAISADGATVRFGDLTVLEAMSFEVSEGAFVAVIGPNGSGKTTLLNALLGAQRLSEGSVRLFGRAPRQAAPETVGHLPQLKTLDRSFPAVALELVVTGIRHGWPWRISAEERSTAIAAMERMGVAEIADRSVAALSGGELQRTFLARCLVRRPRLLVLDEPAAGMDVIGAADLYHLLEDYRKETGATILMVTHDWEGARAHASNVLVIDRGRVTYGAPSEVGSEEHLLRVFGHAGHLRATHGESSDA